MDKHFELDTINMLAATIVDDTIKGAKAGTEKAVMIQTAAYKLAGHIRKPSDENKSVPERCEEAYNGAINLLAAARDLFVYMNSKRGNSWVDMYRDFINKPNPFKEADIAKDDETEPNLLPFSLEDAKNGAKVVTRDGRTAKIICDDLHGFNPIMAIVTNDVGEKTALSYTDKGRYSLLSDHPADLFILKEPETIEIRIMKHKVHGEINVLAPDEQFMEPNKWGLIKTIKTTI